MYTYNAIYYKNNLKAININLIIVLFFCFVAFTSYSINQYFTKAINLNFSLLETNQLEQIEEEFEPSLKFISKNISVKKNDNFFSILKSEKLQQKDIEEIIKILKNNKAESMLKIGQNIIFDYGIKIIDNEDSELSSEQYILNKITIKNKLKSLIIIRQNDNFIAENIDIPLTKSFNKTTIIIKKNFVSSLKSLGLNSHDVINIINAYSHQIDFERQIKSGDVISFISEKFTTKDGEFSHFGKILYVSLGSSGKEYNIYNYSPEKNLNSIFFSEDGKSAKRSLLKTPIKSSRISSHYGNRKHPTLGFTKMHKGVDFAAPTGTPIASAGNGVISDMGWKPCYGNFVQIKHSGTLSTLYAHASKFAKNIKIGEKIKQGQIIAFVGATGRATGPHLHFEVKINGKNVNPSTIKTTPDIELSNKNLVKFAQFKNEIKNLKNKLEKETKLAKL